VIGSTLAHYRVTAALGAGGMGEVWRAEDTKLGREVALKVLPEEFAQDPDRMARVEREAKVLASLNHPNIATLFGLETAIPSGTDSDADSDAGSSPTTFLAMELVEGEDLSERIKRGPIPVDEAIPIALQIAEALEAAHEAGIVHRDLKPANIKLKPDATVKVLDFGLAKAWEAESGDSSLSMSPTMTAHATAAGVILGTAAYMSPEQAAGVSADRRATSFSRARRSHTSSPPCSRTRSIWTPCPTRRRHVWVTSSADACARNRSSGCRPSATRASCSRSTSLIQQK